MGTYRFPSNLVTDKHNTVTFTAFTQAGGGSVTEISLYMPPTIAVSDGASYGNLDLGIIGSGDGIEKLIGKDGQIDTSGLTESLNSAGTQLDAEGNKDQAMSSAILAKAFSNFGLGGGVGDRVSDLVLKNRGKAINPNTVLQYTNSEIRQHNFTFKMVAESADEAVSIRAIVNSFRKYMYGVKDGITLEYPAKWQIQFLKIGGERNPFLPEPYTCFLESCQATYNTSSGLTHNDGSPIEVDVTLAFREVKALSRTDIEALVPKLPKEKRGV